MASVFSLSLIHIFCLAATVLYSAAADVFVHDKCQVTFLLLEFGDRLEGAFFAVPSGEDVYKRQAVRATKLRHTP